MSSRSQPAQSFLLNGGMTETDHGSKLDALEAPISLLIIWAFSRSIGGQWRSWPEQPCPPPHLPSRLPSRQLYGPPPIFHNSVLSLLCSSTLPARVGNLNVAGNITTRAKASPSHPSQLGTSPLPVSLNLSARVQNFEFGHEERWQRKTLVANFPRAPRLLPLGRNSYAPTSLVIFNALTNYFAHHRLGVTATVVFSYFGLSELFCPQVRVSVYTSCAAQILTALQLA